MRNVLITGASRGIGAAAARAFAKNGDRVIVNYKSSEREALSLAEELGGIAFCADVASSAQVKKMFESVGRVDVLVNNAGVSGFSLFDKISDEEWNRIIGVNLSGAFYCTREVLPQMIERKCGAIVNVSSMWGIAGASCEAAYSAAKAGLIGMTKALAKEVGPSGITVNCVAPGVIDTDMNAVLSKEAINDLCGETPLGRIGKPEEVAEAILYLARDDGFVTGQVLTVDGGMIL